jgi:thiamine-monophosphate kinase
MVIGEFQLIDRFFRPLGLPQGRRRSDVVLGVGDDAALLSLPPGLQLVAALDTLVEGRHFPLGSPAHSIGHRALAVNLSDLAAMGADPAWFLLALTLPAAEENFLTELARGMTELAARFNMALVGGDTTAGPLSLSVQALGTVRPGEALLRSGANPGDLLFVSGTPGDAAAGLQLEMTGVKNPTLDDANPAVLRQRFLYPTPRIALGRALRGLASACIDISDGLAADAGKLAEASGCGVRIEAVQLPLSAALRDVVGREEAVQLALSGGDDYELCFTLPAVRLAELPERLAGLNCPVTCIGVIESQPGVVVFDQGRPLSVRAGYDHFAGGG